MTVSTSSASVQDSRRTVVLEGALCVQRGIPMFLGYLSASLVTAHTKVDVHEPISGQGYQRAIAQGRIRKIMAYYDHGGLFPNPLIMNLRDYDMPEVRVLADGPTVRSFESAKRERSNWAGAGRVEFPHGVPLWLYDGQHRQAALAELMKALPEVFGNFPVPVVLTLGLSRHAEAREFYELNANAMAVPTDLAWTLLASLASSDPELRATLVLRDKEWLIKAEKVTTMLERLDGPWRGKFLQANTRKRKNDGTLVRKAQFVRSLRPILDFPMLRHASAEDITQVVNAHWQGIAQVLPEAFNDPASYVIQKGTGINTFHSLLPQVLEVIRGQGRRLTDPAAHAEILAGLKELAGTAIIEGVRMETSGAEFWRAGSAASTFSGNTGKRSIRALVQAVLPAPDKGDIF